jgi:Na+/H+-dicarboxylate symporter
MAFPFSMGLGMPFFVCKSGKIKEKEFTMSTMTATVKVNNANWWKRLQVWQKVLIGLILGAVTGFLLGEDAAILHPIGKAFIAAIKMLVVPLIFISLVCGVTAIKDVTRMGRIGIKTFVTYIVTTGIAIPIGLALAVWLEPGVGMDLGSATAIDVKSAPSIVDTLLGIIPTNPFASFANGDVLQIILFAIFLGMLREWAIKMCICVSASFRQPLIPNVPWPLPAV